VKSKLVFTRYLYLKDEVLLSLLMSLLNKKENAALFWAFEIYYSGFEEELFQHLFKLYYDFYYTLNPSFQEYFIKKYKEWQIQKDGLERDKIVAFIVSDLLIRPHNLDVFLLRQSVQYATVEEPPSPPPPSPSNSPSPSPTPSPTPTPSPSSFNSLLESKNFQQIATFVLEKKSDTIIQDTIRHFQKKGLQLDEKKISKKMKKSSGFLAMNAQIQILAWIMQCFSILSGVKMGKKMYVIVDTQTIVVYETLFVDERTNYKSYKILPLACLHKIDEDNYLHLFHLERNSLLIDDADALRKIYWYNWEYYASFSPFWQKKIQDCKGTWDHQNKKIVFPEDDDIDWSEEFYAKYGYEPDEQKQEIQEKSIQKIQQIRTWRNFFEQHNTHGLYTPEPSLLDEMKSLVY